MDYRLDELFDLQMGKTPARNNTEYWNSEDYKWISIGDLSKCGKYIYETKEYLSEKAVQESGINLIPANTVIMSFKLSIGKTAITPGPMYSNEAIMSFRDKKTVELIPDYIYYMFSGRDWDTGTNKAVMGKTLNKATLSQIRIRVHSLPEQQEIVRVLDTAKAIIEARQRELQKLDELVKARFVELTEDSKAVPTRMGDIATYLNGYAFKPTQWEENGLPIIRIQNLNDATAPYNFYSGTLADKYLVQNGDVLVSWATHLEAYIWKGQDAWLNQHIFKVVFDKMEVNEVYFVYACEEALRQAFRNAHGFKPTMEHIKKADFDDAIVRLPGIEVQKKFADFVKQVDKSKVVVQQALDKAQLLFDSLMQEYFE